VFCRSKKLKVIPPFFRGVRSRNWTYPDFVDSFLTGFQPQVDAVLSPAGVAQATQTPAGGNLSSG
jgi:hypothetical protein